MKKIISLHLYWAPENHNRQCLMWYFPIGLQARGRWRGRRASWHFAKQLHVRKYITQTAQFWGNALHVKTKTRSNIWEPMRKSAISSYYENSSVIPARPNGLARKQKLKKLGFTRDDLRSLRSRSDLHASRRKSFTDWPPNSSQRKFSVVHLLL